MRYGRFGHAHRDHPVDVLTAFGFNACGDPARQVRDLNPTRTRSDVLASSGALRPYLNFQIVGRDFIHPNIPFHKAGPIAATVRMPRTSLATISAAIAHLTRRIVNPFDQRRPPVDRRRDARHRRRRDKPRHGQSYR